MAGAHYLYSVAVKDKGGYIRISNGCYSDVLMRTDDGWNPCLARGQGRSELPTRIGSKIEFKLIINHIILFFIILYHLIV